MHRIVGLRRVAAHCFTKQDGGIVKSDKETLSTKSIFGCADRSYTLVYGEASAPSKSNLNAKCGKIKRNYCLKMFKVQSRLCPTRHRSASANRQAIRTPFPHLESRAFSVHSSATEWGWLAGVQWLERKQVQIICMNLTRNHHMFSHVFYFWLDLEILGSWWNLHSHIIHILLESWKVHLCASASPYSGPTAPNHLFLLDLGTIGNHRNHPSHAEPTKQMRVQTQKNWRDLNPWFWKGLEFLESPTPHGVKNLLSVDNSLKHRTLGPAFSVSHFEAVFFGCLWKADKTSVTPKIPKTSLIIASPLQTFIRNQNISEWTSVNHSLQYQRWWIWTPPRVFWHFSALGFASLVSKKNDIFMAILLSFSRFKLVCIYLSNIIYIYIYIYIYIHIYNYVYIIILYTIWFIIYTSITLQNVHIRILVVVYTLTMKKYSPEHFGILSCQKQDKTRTYPQHPNPSIGST